MSVLTSAMRDAMPSILQAVQAREGMTSEEIGAALGLPMTHARRAACELRAQGQLVLLRSPVHGAQWFTPAVGLAEGRRREQIAAHRRRERNRIASGRYYRERRAAQAGGAEQDMPIVQRLGVDPRLPLPFVCRAPASVFHLGAGL